jgi:hypothetical protein
LWLVTFSQRPFSGRACSARRERFTAVVSRLFGTDYNGNMPAADPPAKLSRRRSWFRYSLSTLFILLTIGCVWLGYIVNRAQRQQRAMVMVHELDGIYYYDSRGAFPLAPLDSSSTLRERPGLELFRHVRGILLPLNPMLTTRSANASRPNDEDTKKLRHLHKLETLHICGGSITDESCRHFVTLPSLRELGLHDTSITDKGLEQIGEIKRLESLTLLDTAIRPRASITSVGLSHLTELKQLSELDLFGTHIDDAGLEHLTKLPRLKSLNLSKTRITNDGLSVVATIPLESLFLHATQIDDAGVEHLARMTKLEHLGIEGSRISPTGFERLKQMMPNCTDISY